MAKRSSFKIFLAVQHALFLREVNVRFSAGTMGYFWVIFEPLLQIFIFVTVKVLLFGSNSSLDYPVFITLGFVGFNFFRHIVDQLMGAFPANKGLYSYKQVKPIDTIISRVLVEFLVTFIIVVIFVFIGLYLGFDMNVENLGMLLLSFLWLTLFSIGLGLFFAVISTFYDSLKKVIKLVLSPLMFVSAVFYSMQNMPQSLQDLLYFNPLAHFMELLHAYYFDVLDDGFVDYNYLLMWTLIPLYIGLWSYYKLEQRIISL
ncbi:Polysialic acid transport protein KpsM [hydrothermal vent metagenome]|uniref:Polysialic acid transport protein KpsM n=1 Tax=hydrothermal vent metagenome TaxID=652676 RepID=A0A1W1CWH6_9ZZZZ